MNIALVFAGGVGKRLNRQENSLPKQFLQINGKPIIVHTLEIFQRHPAIDKIYISIHPSYLKYMNQLVSYYHLTKTAGIVKGGKTGQDSIYNALKLAAKENPATSLVLVHDGVRPNITSKVIDDNLVQATKYGNAITCTACQETVLVSKNYPHPSLVPPRRETFLAQAPQTFRLKELLNAHEKMRKTNPDYTDIVDSFSLFNALGKKTYLVEGNRGNIKITTVEDLYLLRAMLRLQEDILAFSGGKANKVSLGQTPSIDLSVKLS